MSFVNRLIILIIFLFIVEVGYAENFIVRNIQIEGLQGISQATVLSYMPIHIGQNFTDSDSATIIRSLYNTGFFNNVRLLRRGNTLIVQVQERPIIGSLQIIGNKAIAAKKLRKALSNFGIAEGQPYDNAKVNAIQLGLQQQYEEMGYHEVRITVNVTQEPRNRVALVIHVVEGSIAKIKSIEIIGAHAFSQRTLLANFKLTSAGLFTFWSHRDRYSQIQLTKDLQSLTDFYLNHGYLRFRVLSHQAILSQDGKSVTVIITVAEGPVYRVSGHTVIGKFANDIQVQRDVSAILVNSIFSRQQIIAVNQKINDYLANKGYAFPQINVIPQINDANHTVFLTFNITEGQRVYVRQIHILGNYRTQDTVLRARLQQMEGEVFSLKKVKESKRQLALLPYLNRVDVTPVPVTGRPDLVDLNYRVNEINAGKVSAQGGYSDVDGIIYGASISEPNFMGSGKYVALGFTNSSYSQNYSFTYNNPLYTLDGVSRGYQIYYSRTTANPQLNLDTYTMDDVGGQLSYGIPVTNYDSVSLGFGYDYINIKDVNAITSANPASPLVLAFLARSPSPFSQFKISLGLSHVTLDRAVFPTSGTTQSIISNFGVPVIDRSVSFYTVTYDGKWYWPLGGSGFVIEPHADAGYGGAFSQKESFPFYNNYYAGGIGTMPGFETNSLGPVNPNNGNNATGGNVELLGGIDFIVPNHISDRLRTAVFVDAGNIFETNHLQYNSAQFAQNPRLRPMTYEDIALDNIRVSTGLLISWYSPLGLLNLSLGVPVVRKTGDVSQLFGFSFGTSL